MTLCNIKEETPYWNSQGFVVQPSTSLSARFVSDFDIGNTWVDKRSGVPGLIVGASRVNSHPSGVFGKCIQFNGAEHISGSTSFLNNQNSFSISIWFNTTDITLASRLYSEANSIATSSLLSISINNPSTNQINFGIRDSAGIYGSIESPQLNITDGKWHNILAISESTSSRKLYIDGVFQGSNNTLLGTRTTSNFSMGALVRNDITRYYTGLLGEVDIWTSAITEADVLYNYRNSPYYYLNNV